MLENMVRSSPNEMDPPFIDFAVIQHGAIVRVIIKISARLQIQLTQNSALASDRAAAQGILNDLLNALAGSWPVTHHPAKAEHLFNELLSAIPEYSPNYRMHLTENDELLPYVLMNDFSRFVVEAHTTGKRDVFERCIRFLNDRFIAAGDDVRLLVRSTFGETVESLWSTPELFSAIYDSLVPELQKSIRTFDWTETVRSQFRESIAAQGIGMVYGRTRQMATALLMRNVISIEIPVTEVDPKNWTGE